MHVRAGCPKPESAVMYLSFLSGSLRHVKGAPNYLAKEIEFAKALLVESDACCIGLWKDNHVVSH